MAGPKYVDKFEFPTSAGFTGSATDKTTTTVRSHERAKPQRFAEGGRVSAREQRLHDELAVNKNITPAQRRQILAEAEKTKRGRRHSVVDLVGGRERRAREADLGLAMGGPVKARKGGTVRGPKGGFNRTPLIGK